MVGTHTHVPTADFRVLPGGTAYITDVGMTGPRGGVIGVKKEQAVESMRTHMSLRFETSEDDPWLMGVLISCSSEPRRATSIEQLLVPWSPSSATSAGPEEPDDVEVEPVRHAELQRDQDRAAQRGEADHVAPARQERDGHREDDGAQLHRVLRGRPAVIPHTENGDPREDWKPSVRSRNVGMPP